MNFDYEDLLEKIISTFFKKNNFTLKGKLIWNDVSKKEKERYFKKNGNELINQRVKYKTSKIFWEKKYKAQPNKNNLFFYNHILISEFEENNIIYCIVDHCVGRMGEVIRYKFEIKGLINTEMFEINLIDDIMLKIR